MMKIDGSTRVQPVQTEPNQNAATKAPVNVNNQEHVPAFQTKARDLAFTGAVIGARLNRQVPAPPPPLQTPNINSTGKGTETKYKIGDPARPNIHHDNGFLQNPKDPKDPKPIATVAPSRADRIFYAKELAKAQGALAAIGVGADKLPFAPHELSLRDGIEAYEHFLTGNGSDRTFSYDKFVNDDASGKTILRNAATDLQKGVEDIYKQMIARDPSLKDKPVTFKITGGAITVGGSNKFPYPETENWQKAIGGHTVWSSGTVTIKPPTTPGGKPQFSMNMTLHAEDRYNFNPGQADIATGVPDATRGKLEQTGLARQYMNYAALQRNVAWTSGDIKNSTTTVNPNNR